MTILNNDSEINKDTTPLCEVVGETPAPDEASNLSFDGKFRIFDPVSNKTLLEGKA